MKTTTTATQNRAFRALLTRFLCLGHLTLSAFILYHVKSQSLVYLVPTLATFVLLAESVWVVVIRRGSSPLAWVSTCFFIYVPTIVACYWLLELDNLPKITKG